MELLPPMTTGSRRPLTTPMMTSNGMGHCCGSGAAGDSRTERDILSIYKRGDSEHLAPVMDMSKTLTDPKDVIRNFRDMWDKDGPRLWGKGRTKWLLKRRDCGKPMADLKEALSGEGVVTRHCREYVVPASL